MRISDWSSDVCSSDLVLLDPVSDAAEPVHQLQPDREPFGARRRGDGGAHAGLPALAASSIASRASNMPGVSLSHAWRWPIDRKSTRLNSSHSCATRMPPSSSKKKQYILQKNID